MNQPTLLKLVFGHPNIDSITMDIYDTIRWQLAKALPKFKNVNDFLLWIDLGVK